MKKNILIAVVIVAFGLVVAFMADSSHKKIYGDPFKMGERFVRAYIENDVKTMKRLSISNVHEKISGMKSGIGSYSIDFLTLMSSKKIGDKLMRTYSYNEPAKPPLFCSVVLQPQASRRVSARLIKILTLGIKKTVKEWRVFDFFTNEDFEKYISDKITKIEKGEISPLEAGTFTDDISRKFPAESE